MGTDNTIKNQLEKQIQEAKSLCINLEALERLHDKGVEITSEHIKRVERNKSNIDINFLKQGKEMGKFYWSAIPGDYIDPYTGQDPYENANVVKTAWTGTLTQWYDNLVQLLYRVSAMLQFTKYTLRVSPKIANILRNTTNYKKESALSEKVHEIYFIEDQNIDSMKVCCDTTQSFAIIEVIKI